MASALKPWHLVALSGLVWACTRPKKAGPEVGNEGDPAPGEPLEPVRELYFWAHDSELVLPAYRAARRIKAATGLEVHVNDSAKDPDSIKTSIPIYGSDFLCAHGTKGTASGFGIVMARDCGWDPEMVLLHEMIHHLGVGHLVLPQRGVMNDGNDKPESKLTADDLNAICAVRHCTKFVPEM